MYCPKTAPLSYESSGIVCVPTHAILAYHPTTLFVQDVVRILIKQYEAFQN